MIHPMRESRYRRTKVQRVFYFFHSPIIAGRVPGRGGSRSFDIATFSDDPHHSFTRSAVRIIHFVLVSLELY